MVVNAAGYGAELKQQTGFDCPVRDVSELLVDLGLRRTGLKTLGLAVAYQDACHLAHAQRIRRQPRSLLEQIPGLRLLELPNPDQCCGAAGVYSLTHRALALQVLEAKLRDIESSAAAIVATASRLRHAASKRPAGSGIRRERMPPRRIARRLI